MWRCATERSELFKDAIPMWESEENKSRIDGESMRKSARFLQFLAHFGSYAGLENLMQVVALLHPRIQRVPLLLFDECLGFNHLLAKELNRPQKLGAILL